MRITAPRPRCCWGSRRGSTDPSPQRGLSATANSRLSLGSQEANATSAAPLQHRRVHRSRRRRAAPAPPSEPSPAHVLPSFITPPPPDPPTHRMRISPTHPRAYSSLITFPSTSPLRQPIASCVSPSSSSPTLAARSPPRHILHPSPRDHLLYLRLVCN
ncbi:hypothetical protein R3P38DRAFT_3193455 [Favolaschia claudopus]|uniref:Uncharacterized protein n=1 Tax=Favolaschia claudopus TaxID=2862362 RepID=A0AAW0BIL1_9AGAR